MLIAVVFFVIISTLIIFSLSSTILDQLRLIAGANYSKQSYFLAESLHEDLVYRLKYGMNTASTETLQLAGYTAEAKLEDTMDSKIVTTTGEVEGAVRNLKSELLLGDGVAFNYGVQADQGGIELRNSASVVGNVYANHSVTGSDNMVYGTVVSAGPNGLIDNIHATGSAYAHTIQDSWVEEDAYYHATTTISNTVVEGDRYPESENQATSSLPISDEQIEDWQAAAEAGGINDCGGDSEYEIKNQDATLGPEKIECDLAISGNNMTVSFAGPVWVEGSILVGNGPTVAVDSSLGSKSVAIIADNPADRETGSQIDLDNSAVFEGADEGSYILFISQNHSAESGGNNFAINIANSLSGDVMTYAGHGEIIIRNNTEVKQLTGYKITGDNSAKIVFQTGVVSLLFDSGPGGGFTINSWQEVAEY